MGCGEGEEVSIGLLCAQGWLIVIEWCGGSVVSPLWLLFSKCPKPSRDTLIVSHFPFLSLLHSHTV